MQEKHLTTAQAADYMGVSVQTVYRLRAKGKLAAYRTTGREWRYLISEIDVYLRSVSSWKNVRDVLRDDLNAGKEVRKKDIGRTPTTASAIKTLDKIRKNNKWSKELWQ